MMKVGLTAFNGLMRGEVDIPKIIPQIMLVMDCPSPRLCTAESEFPETLRMKRAVFEYDSALSLGDEALKHYYKLVDVR